MRFESSGEMRGSFQARFVGSPATPHISPLEVLASPPGLRETATHRRFCPEEERGTDHVTVVPLVCFREAPQARYVFPIAYFPRTLSIPCDNNLTAVGGQQRRKQEVQVPIAQVILRVDPLICSRDMPQGFRGLLNLVK